MSDDVFSKWSPQIDLAISKYGRGAASDARQDLRQEILLALYQAGESLLPLDARNENEARGLAFRIARNAVISYLRPSAEKVSRRSVSLDDPQIKSGLNNADGGRMDNKFFQQLVLVVSKGPPSIDTERAIEALPEDEQTVVRMLYFEGLPQEQVAAVLGKTRHWVREKKESALKELKRLLRN